MGFVAMPSCRLYTVPSWLFVFLFFIVAQPLLSNAAAPGAERQKMDCRVTTPPRIAFGECGFRRRSGSISGQSGRFLHVLVFWRLFPASFGREGQKRLCFGGCFRRFGVLVVVYASCRREGEGEEEEREYDGIKTDLTVKIEI